MVRVHELARELDCTSNELLKELKKLGSTVVKALSSVPAEEETILRAQFSKGSKAPADTATGKGKPEKSKTLNDGSDGYEPVRLKKREAGIKRDFRGSEQKAASTSAPKPPRTGPAKQREQTSTKIIKKTIVRRRFVPVEDRTESQAPIDESPQDTSSTDVQPSSSNEGTRGRKRRSLSIEGATLPSGRTKDTKARVPASQKGTTGRKTEGKATSEAPTRGRKRVGRVKEPGKKSPDTRRPGEMERHKPSPPKPKDLQKSLEQLQKKGIKADLTTSDRKAAASKKTKKKRKKIMGPDKSRPFGRDRRGGGQSRGKDLRAASRQASGPIRRKGRRRHAAAEEVQVPVQQLQRMVKVTPSMTIKDLCESTGIKANEIIKFLVSDLGVMATINQVVDLDIIKLILENFEFEYDVKIREVEDEIDTEPDKEEDLDIRPPVVVVLGHVDHGKTKLLDAIRHANVIDTEAGAITQHIGAYQAEVNDRKITFLDTPGHEAFTAMRARGAQVTDIAILVVACDDGVMPQTIEAINHAKAAGLEIIVALNKIDKDSADPERLKSQLAEHELLPEEWGGKTIMAPISAKFGQGIDELLEMVILSADILNLKGNAKVKAVGTVLEARLDKGLGVVATVLVQRGTLKPGDVVNCGTSWGKIRQMTDEKGQVLEEAGPSTPCLITGLSEVPDAGDKLYQVKDEKVAKEIYNQRQIIKRKEKMLSVNRVSLEDFFEQLEQGVVKDLNLIIKADVQGSIEALVGSLEKLTIKEVKVNIVHSAVGNINEGDIMLAVASKAIVIGFTVSAGPGAMREAQLQGVDVRRYDVIYKVLEDIELAIQGMLEPEFEERIIGRAEVRAIFRKTKDSIIAGLYVTEKKIVRGMKMRITRDGELIHEGKLDSLKRFKEDAKEVEQDFECGISLSGYNDLKEGDVIEGYEVIEITKMRIGG